MILPLISYKEIFQVPCSGHAYLLENSLLPLPSAVPNLAETLSLARLLGPVCTPCSGLNFRFLFPQLLRVIINKF